MYFDYVITVIPVNAERISVTLYFSSCNVTVDWNFERSFLSVEFVKYYKFDLNHIKPDVNCIKISS